MFEAGHRAEVVYSGLAGRSAAGGRQVGLGVVKVHSTAAGGVREATCRHAEEHGFADSSRYLVAVYRGGVLGVDDCLHLYIAVSVGEEPAYVPKSDWPYSFEPADCAA
jgi:hypothetical protein